MSELISITGLNKYYVKKHGVSNVNLSIHKGQIVGLVGPNGAGKTTCLQSLLGLTEFEGDINVLGYHPRKDREKMLNDVAYISDVAILPKWLKVTQALSFMNDVHPNFDIEKARQFLAKTNIDMNDKVKALLKTSVPSLADIFVGVMTKEIYS
ncbi:MAG: ATP-binding cassette domain-containing protein [Alteromonadaceae bacterium]